jgi:hypothetical protein
VVVCFVCRSLCVSRALGWWYCVSNRLYGRDRPPVKPINENKKKFNVMILHHSKCDTTAKGALGAEASSLACEVLDLREESVLLGVLDA